MAVKYSVVIPWEQSAWEMVLKDPAGVLIRVLLSMAWETMSKSY